MKLSTFTIKATGKQTIGVYQNEKYLDIVSLSGGKVSNSMQAVLAAGEPALAQIRTVAAAADGKAHSYGPDEVTLAVPVRPGKIIHTSCNFDAHLDELTAWEAPGGKITAGATSLRTPHWIPRGALLRRGLRRNHRDTPGSPGSWIMK